jgi:hypothetical protein
MKEKTERETRDHRWIAISGLLFVAAWVAGLLVTSPPVVTTPMADLIASYSGQQR